MKESIHCLVTSFAKNKSDEFYGALIIKAFCMVYVQNALFFRDSELLSDIPPDC